MPEVSGLYYADLGQGPPLVMLHALGLDSGVWTLQVPLLAQRYRVIRPDTRGHGRSPYNGEEISIASLADDLLTLADHLDLRTMAIAGLSMGGMIAQQFAITHPDRVSALVLVSTVPVFSEQARKGLRERARTAQAEGMEPLIEPALERWFTPRFRTEAATNLEGTVEAGGEVAPDPYEAALINAISRMLEYADPKGYAAVCRALAEADLTPDLGSIRCPTLVVSGEQDPGISEESQAALLAGIKDRTRSVFPESSHLVPVENAKEFNSQLLSFLSWSKYR